MPEIEQETRYRVIAERHGVDFDSVTPPSREDRLRELEACLARTDVPYPIDSKYASEYLALARSGVPFSIGSLCEQSVDLGSYSNQQHYDKYTLEEHLSWACLIAEQQRTKHQFACREYLECENFSTDSVATGYRQHDYSGGALLYVSLATLLPGHNLHAGS
jgi:hypothetical protein